jgi:uncharacterized protein YbjT (DUF2867 family)
MTHTAIVLGASGSVGQALLEQILSCPAFAPVIVLVRRPMGLAAAAGPRVVEHVVPDMQPAQLEQAVVDALAGCGPGAVGFSVLGIGAGTARLSLAEHRAVDVELNAAFARGLVRSTRVRHLVFMSAIGADPHASTSGSGAAGMPRYARVKGEAEQAVQRQGPQVVSILRPSVIIGSRHTPALLAHAMPLLSPLLPARVRPIRSTEIARAMVALACHTPPSSGIYGYAEMRALAAGAA